MKIFRHYCLYGDVYDWHTIDPKLSKEIPTECPLKEGCGKPWEEVDLSMYKNDPIKIFVDEFRKE